MKKIIDNFQANIGDVFSQFTLTASSAEAGLDLISKSSGTCTVSLSLGGGIQTEPVTFDELKSHQEDSKSRVVSLYQNIMISTWSDLLDEIFNFLLKQNFDGVRVFSELKKVKVTIDFLSNDNYADQIMAAVSKDFSFKSYADRFKLVDGIINQDKKLPNEITTIKKHVLIRNSIQHHGSKVYGDLLSQLGVNELVLLDPDANEVALKEDDGIRVSVAELDELKRALHLLSQEWRKNY